MKRRDTKGTYGERQTRARRERMERYGEGPKDEWPSRVSERNGSLSRSCRFPRFPFLFLSLGLRLTAGTARETAWEGPLLTHSSPSRSHSVPLLRLVILPRLTRFPRVPNRRWRVRRGNQMSRSRRRTECDETEAVMRLRRRWPTGAEPYGVGDKTLYLSHLTAVGH